MTNARASHEAESAPAGEGIIRSIRFEIAPRTILSLVLIALGFWLLTFLWPVVLVVVIALLIVGTLNPLVAWFEGRGFRRGIGIAIVFTALLLVSLATLTLTIPELAAQGSSLAEQWPTFRDQAATYLERSGLTSPLAQWLREFEFETPSNGELSETVLGVAGFVIYGASTIFLALYVMIERDRLRGGLFALVPREHHIRLSRVLVNLETIVGAYLRGQMLTSLFIAVFSFVLLLLCGVPNALALAVFAGLADVLPYIGALLGITPMVLAAASQGPVAAVVVLAAMLAYEEFESRLLIPRLYGRVLRLPSAVVLVSLLAGGALMGILGALLALPVAATIRMLIEELRVELPGDPEQPKDAEVRREDRKAELEYEHRTEGAPAEQAAAVAVEISKDRQENERCEAKASQGKA